MSNDVVYQSKGALIQFIETNMGTITATAFIGDGSLLQNVTGSGGGGGGDVSVSGTPSNNEVPTWTDGTTIKGEGNLTFDGSTLTVTGDENLSGDLTVNGGDIYSIDAGGGDLFLRRNDSSIVADEILGNIYFQATENGSDVSFGAAIRGVATEAFVFPDDEGTKLEFLTTPNGSGLYGVAMTLDGDGNLDIAGDLTVTGQNIKSPADLPLFFNTDKSMYFDIDEDNDETDQIFRWRAYSTTLMTLGEDGNLDIAGTTLTLGSSGYSAIHDSAGNNRIYFDTGTPQTYVYPGGGGAPKFKVASTKCTVVDDLDIAGALTVSTAGSTIAQEAWNAPTLESNWSNYGGDYVESGYMKDTMGFVHIRGMIDCDGAGDDIFTLPAGYRPASKLIFVVLYYDNGTYRPGRVDITSAGVVSAIFPTSPAAADWVSLEGLTFDTR